MGDEYRVAFVDRPEREASSLFCASGHRLPLSWFELDEDKCESDWTANGGFERVLTKQQQVMRIAVEFLGPVLVRNR
jgi:hypothetical protein